jgi:membrane protease subunit (stomatin/prohibitin family)
MAIIDRIKYDAPSDDIFVWKFSSEEIKWGSQLIVNPSQEALFVRSGNVCDVFTSGTYTLSTYNLPILYKIINLPFGGDTPFSAEVWFVNKTVKRDLKWGTRSPIPLIDPVYNYPISLRAFGQWGAQVLDSVEFIKKLVGSMQSAKTDRVADYFIGEINQNFANVVAEFLTAQEISIFQINAKINELAQQVKTALDPIFAAYGIQFLNFNIDRISLPENELAEFQRIFGKRMEIEQISRVQVGQSYTTMRSLDILEKAADNPNGTAGAMLAGGMGLGIGAGAGISLGKEIGKSMEVQSETSDNPMRRIEVLKSMLDRNLITKNDFEIQKQRILNSI